MSNKIKSIIGKDMVEIDELQKFAEAQFNTIIELNSKIEKLKDENLRLKNQLQVNEKQSNDPIKLMELDEETICKLEIQKLKNSSLERSLSYEESKKLQIYVELLLKIQNKPKTIEINTKKMKDTDLLALLDETNE